jgi:hypothetical protein
MLGVLVDDPLAENGRIPGITVSGPEYLSKMLVVGSGSSATSGFWLNGIVAGGASAISPAPDPAGKLPATEVEGETIGADGAGGFPGTAGIGGVCGCSSAMNSSMLIASSASAMNSFMLIAFFFGGS